MNRYLRTVILTPLLMIAMGCQTQQMSSGGGDPQLDQAARTELNKLYDTTPKAKELQGHVKAILVFPTIYKAGFLVDAQGGNGVMFDSSGKVLGYYNASAFSYGVQAGAQEFSEAMFLMNQDAVNFLQTKSDGWSIGVGPSVVVLDDGAARALTTKTMQSDVYAFLFAQEGLMAGIGGAGPEDIEAWPTSVARPDEPQGLTGEF